MDAHQKALRTLTIAVLLFVSGDVGRTAPQVRRNEVRPSRIISVVPAVTEMLFAIGAGSQVVGVGSYDHFPLEADRLPKVGALIDPDF
jgi:ABC-type hemin transport system substrate-binding protein